MTEPLPEPSKDRNWPKDEFGRSEIFAQFWWFILPLVVLLATVAWFGLSHLFSRNSTARVVAYCAQDQVYAEPIFRNFEEQTGIKVKAVYDSEAVKTVGLASRLLAERSHPQCDVFWGNEEMRTRQLAAQNVFRETNGWAAFGYRSRRIVINTNRLSLADAPQSLSELTAPLSERTHELGLAREGGSGLSAIRHNGRPFSCSSPGLG